MDTFYWNLISLSYNSKYLPIILLINIHTLSSMFSKKKKRKTFRNSLLANSPPISFIGRILHRTLSAGRCKTALAANTAVD